MSKYGEMALRDERLNAVGSVKLDAALKPKTMSMSEHYSLIIHVFLLLVFYLSGFFLYK